MVNKWQRRPQEPLAVGSFFTTPADYARLFSATFATGQKSYPSENRLPARYLGSMLQPQIKISKNFEWSLIWGIEQHQNESFFFQWGDNPGFKHFAVSANAKRAGLVVLTNGQNGLRVCRPLVETILGRKLIAFDNI